uniref:Helix-turn-helix XRE-family like protein n=1 Tax=Siphoviridae sp. ct4Am4 TaxID=2826287 RepID=A0A8S5R240_9CAUD|nr:MAG TPA: helix-turn-helix XRE-family like protein [Siphoviridae sp. ct4Am4]
MNRIKQCREKSNLSQKYVAVALGVAAPSVSNWENEQNQTMQRKVKP